MNDSMLKDSDKNEILNGLRKMMFSGCTCTELMRFIEAYLGTDTNNAKYSNLVSNAFNVFARDLQPASQLKHPLAASILNTFLLLEIVDNREHWQSQASCGESWMDKIKFIDLAEDDETIPLRLSPAGWDSLSDSDKDALLRASRSHKRAACSSSVLSVLCEQLQLKLHMLQNENSRNPNKN